MGKKIKLKCCECDEPVEFDKYKDPETGKPMLVFDETPTGEPICERCLEQMAPRCALCEDENVWNRGEIGSVFIVTRAAELDIPVGTYRVVAHPLYWNDCVGGDIYPDAVEKLGDSDHNVGQDHWFPCDTYLVCDDCAAKLIERDKESTADLPINL